MRVYRKNKDSTMWMLDFVDPLGRRQRLSSGVSSKRAAEQIGRFVEELVACRLAKQPLSSELQQWIEQAPSRLRRRLAEIGLIDVQRAAGGRPLTELLEDFKKTLLAEGATEKHVAQQARRIERLVSGCGFVCFSDIVGGKVLDFVAGLNTVSVSKTDDGQPKWTRPSSVSTKNYHLKAFKHFCNWAETNRLTPHNPLKCISLIKDSGGRIKRRPMMIDEIPRLLHFTQAGPTRFGVTGQERCLTYRMGLELGLRANELRTLEVSDLDLAGETVTIRAENAKNRQEVVLPLRPDLTEILRRHTCGKLPHARVVNVPAKTAEMFYEDCAGAGIDPRDNGSGRLCFHSLRHTFASQLAAAGVAPKVAQDLLRHGDIRQTMNIYSHAYHGQLIDAVSQLPDFTKPGREVQKKTGTEGGELVGNDGVFQGAVRGAKLSGKGRMSADFNGPIKGPAAERESIKKPHFHARNAVLRGDNTHEADGSRTRNPRIDSPFQFISSRHAISTNHNA